jgi:AAA domain
VSPKTAPRPYGGTGQDTRISLIQVLLAGRESFLLMFLPSHSFFLSLLPCSLLDIWTLIPDSVQGPPGTGKTSAILGMVSALLHRCSVSPSAASSASASTSPPASQGIGEGIAVSNTQSDSAANMGLIGTDNGAHKKQRLLLCAPSNAAVDELLLRLLKGVYNSHGVLVVMKVRLTYRTFLHPTMYYVVSSDAM